MSQDTHRDIAKVFLEETGYQVKTIPSNNLESRADLFAKSNRDCLVIEVKSRCDEDDLFSRFKNTPDGEHISFKRKLRRNESVAKVIKKAAKQIEVTQRLYPNAFGVLWIRPDHKFGLLDTFEIIEANLFGVRWAHVTKHDRTALWQKCYFSDYQDFFRHKVINAVVYNKGENAQLIPNPYSDNSDIFRDTLLFRDFMSVSAVFDSEAIIKSGDVLFLKQKVDLKSEEEVQRALVIDNNVERVLFADMLEIGGLIPVKMKK